MFWNDDQMFDDSTMMVHGPNHFKELENNDKDIAKQSSQKKVPEKSLKKTYQIVKLNKWMVMMTQHDSTQFKKKKKRNSAE